MGNDSRQDRVFNPVKQAHDYGGGEYIKNWIEALRPLSSLEDDLEILYQPWKMCQEKKAELKLAGQDFVEQPLKKIEWNIRKNAGRRGGRAGGKGGKADGSRGGASGGGGYHGRGRGEKSRGQIRKGRLDRENEIDP